MTADRRSSTGESGKITGTGTGSVQQVPPAEPPADPDAAGPGRRRELGGVAGLLLNAVCLSIVVLALAYAFDAASLIGEAFHREQYLSIFLGLTLLASYLAYAPVSARTPQRQVPPYDLLLGVVALLAAWYPAFNYDEMVMSVYLMPTHLVILATVTLVLVLEGARRVAGLPIVVIALIFIGYAFVSDLMPGEFYNRAIKPERLAVYLYIDSNAILGLPLAIAMSIVLAFILFGSALEKSGATLFFIDLATALMARYRGGAGKIAVISSALFGSISGSAVSNVVSTGVITIPMMRKAGFSRVQSGAIEATASTGGQIMPPIMGATAFLMAEMLNTSYASIVVAALIPAILYFTGVFFYVHFLAVRIGLRRGEPEPGRTAWRILRSQGIYLAPLIAIVVALFWLNWRPERAAYLGVAVALAVHVLQQRALGRGYFAMIASTGHMALQITLITAVAGIIIGCLNITSLGFTLTLVLTALGDGSLIVLLVLVALLCIVLGMGMPTTGVYLVLAVLAAPAISAFDVPAIAAHMFILFFGVLSFVTPPVCFAAFAAATIAGGGPMRTGLEASKIVVGAYLLPFLFIYNPELLMIGSPLRIAVAALSAALAIALLTMALVGSALRPLRWPERLLAAFAAVLLCLACSPRDLTEYVASAAALGICAYFLLAGRGSGAFGQTRRTV